VKTYAFYKKYVLFLSVKRRLLTNFRFKLCYRYIQTVQSNVIIKNKMIVNSPEI